MVIIRLLRTGLLLGLALISLRAIPLMAAGSPPHAPTARTIQWADRTWNVRSWPGGPGPNNWCDTVDCVWVDSNGALHLTIRYINGQWYATEVSTRDLTNFGEHRFFVEGPIDDLDPNVVLGLFLYSDINDNDIEELDVEFATWGDPDPAAPEGKYTTWYQNAIGDQYTFDVNLNGAYTTHAIDWQPTQVDFESLHGFYDTPPNASYIIAQWSTSNPNVIPIPEDEMRVHMNLWLYSGQPPTDGQEVEIVIHDFKGPPEIPTNLQASDGAFTDRVTLSWDGVPTATSYQVYRAESETGPKTLLGSTTATTFDDTTADYDRTYVYWVTGVNGQGEGWFSDSDTGWRAIPMDVSITLTNTTDVTLSWPDQSAACQYDVYRDLTPYFDPATLTPAASLTPPDSTHTFANDAGNPAENHYYLVQAIGCTDAHASPSNRTGEFDFALTPGS